MSKPNQKTQRSKAVKDKNSQNSGKPLTPTITQVSLTKYITHKELPATQIGPKDNKKRKKNLGEIPPDKRHHKTQESSENMDVNTQNGDLTKEDNDIRTVPANTETLVTENLQDHLNALEQRLSHSITNNVTANITQNLQGTINSFDSTLRTAMESMTSAVNKLIKSN